MELLEGLNSAQATAVQAIEGPVLVLAGPGSGKTRVLTQRVGYLVRECGVQPYHILAVTFTNKAAREMVSRLRDLIGESISRLTIGTFHATCARILRREAVHVGLSSTFAIFDEDDQERLISRVLKELNLDPKLYQPRAIQSAISRAKNELITADTFSVPSYWYEAVARAYRRYEQLKAESNALDFDDLLLRAEELFRTQDEVRERYQRRYHYLLVDEFQDTNRAQYELVRHLAGERRSLFVVGDEDQSIYSWRGADYRNVMRFRADFPDAQVFKLEQSYRSTQTILNVAQAIISRNVHRTPKTLWTQRKGGAPARIFEAYDEHQEAEYVANEVERLVGRGECRRADCAVMFRTNAQSRVLEEAFLRHGVPYQLIGAIRFYQRREIKDVLCYLRLLHNPDDEVSLTRIINVPPRNIGEKTIQQLGEWAARLGLPMGRALQHLAQGGDEAIARDAPFSARSLKALQAFAELLAGLAAATATCTLSELLNLLLEKTDYLRFLRDGTEEGEDRANNVRELLSVTQGYDRTPLDSALPSLLEQAALVADTDEIDTGADRVTLLTFHAAKGLEYDAVFMVGMEEDICPHVRSKEDPNALEEERRLCYVGVTRAKRNLYLVHAFRRTLFGNSSLREPSRFLFDIPPELTDGNRLQVAQSRPAAAVPTPLGSPQDGRGFFAQRRAVVQGGITRRQLREAPERPRPRMPLAASEPERAGRSPGEVVRPTTALPTKSGTSPIPSFHPGEKVTHPTFGVGTVVASKVVGDDEEVTVAFADRGVKRLMASFARLAKN